MSSALVIRAGAAARRLIEKDGLSPNQVKVLAGAAGGPKWLALAHLDRYLFGQWLADRREPLYTIGSSIATWRFTAVAQDDPVAAIDRFAHAYLNEQRYTDQPDTEEISRVCRQLLDALLPDGHIPQLLGHAWLRPHVITALCTGRAASESPRQLKADLARIALSNTLSRQRLALHVQRVVFRHPADRAPFLPFADAFTTHEVALSPENIKPALLGSASIPLMMRGIADIAGAPPGMHRDGGLIDYHMDLHFGVEDGLVLFPHFSTRIVPGWLDKFLPWRKPHAHHLDNVLMIAPSDALLARLPNGKIPDRKDFPRYGGDQDALFADWTRAHDECRRIADELAELIESGDIAGRIQDFPEDSVRV